KKATADEDAKKATADEDAKKATADEDAKKATADEDAKKATADEDAKKATADEDAKKATADEDAKKANAQDEEDKILARTDEAVCDFIDDHLKGNLEFSGSKITVFASSGYTPLDSKPFSPLPQILRMTQKQESMIDIISSIFDSNDFEKEDDPTLTDTFWDRKDLKFTYVYNWAGPYSDDWCPTLPDPLCKVDVIYSGKIRKLSSNYFQSKGNLTAQIIFNGLPLDFSHCE
ncbi:MAG: hypothetical protein OXB86_04205, partial [Bdellovibrionales bacterium]|nr:hypothetical protein [Bdellovibrionales bacterium]